MNFNVLDNFFTLSEKDRNSTLFQWGQENLLPLQGKELERACADLTDYFLHHPELSIVTNGIVDKHYWGNDTKLNHHHLSYSIKELILNILIYKECDYISIVPARKPLYLSKVIKDETEISPPPISSQINTDSDVINKPVEQIVSKNNEVLQPQEPSFLLNDEQNNKVEKDENKSNTSKNSDSDITPDFNSVEGDTIESGKKTYLIEYIPGKLSVYWNFDSKAPRFINKDAKDKKNNLDKIIKKSGFSLKQKDIIWAGISIGYLDVPEYKKSEDVLEKKKSTKKSVSIKK